MTYLKIITTVVTALLLNACGGGDGGFGDALSSSLFNCPITGGPKAITFSPVSGAALDNVITSNEVTIECGSKMGIAASAGTYSINGGAFTDAQGTISDGQRLRLRVRAATTFGTNSLAAVEIGDLGAAGIINTRASFRVTTMPGDPANAPLATILSPQNNANINAIRITVSGQASDPDGISEIRVNDVPASSSDGFSTWTAEIPLVSGTNTITVWAADNLFNIDPTASEITLENSAVVLSDPVDIAMDEANSRILVPDRELRALVGIDLASGEHVAVSDDFTPNNQTPFIEPARIAISSVTNKAWVIDNGYDDLIVVDLATGARSLLLDTTAVGAGESIKDARDIALDENANRAFLLVGVSNSVLNDTRVLSIDLASGARSVLSDESTPNADNSFGKLFDGMSMVFDPVGFRLLVMQADGLLAVDPLTGERSLFSDTGVESAVDATLDISSNRVLVVNRFSSRLWGVDLNSGAAQSLWRLNSRFNPIRIESDPSNNRILVVYRFSSTIFATDMLTGESSIAN